MLRAIRHVVPAACALLVHALAAQPAPGLRFEAPPALQAPRPNSSFAAPGMTEDAAGFVWFATEQGLLRFDGVEVRTYRAAPGGLASNLLYAVLADPTGRLWVTDGAGRLSRFDPLSGRADRVEFPVPGVRALFPALAPDGTLWIGTAEAGLFRLDAGRLEARPVPLPGLETTETPGIVSARADSVGRVWIATARRGLFVANVGEERPRRV